MKVFVKFLSNGTGVLLLLGLFLLPVVGHAATLPATKPATLPATLLNTDCIKCHAQPPADIEAKGLAHKTTATRRWCARSSPCAASATKGRRTLP